MKSTTKILLTLTHPKIQEYLASLGLVEVLHEHRRDGCLTAFIKRLDTGSFEVFRAGFSNRCLLVEDDARQEDVPVWIALRASGTREQIIRELIDRS